MKETIDMIIKWHEQTFPEATLDGQLAKFDEEENEFVHALAGTDDELFELADMVIVSCGIARFDYPKGLSYLYKALDVGRTVDYGINDIWQAVEKKMLRNMRRNWEKKDDVGYHHTKRN